MEGKMSATGHDERGGDEEGERGRQAPSDESFAEDTQHQQQYAQYHQQQQHGYYHPVAPYPADYPGYGPGYPSHGGYRYAYPGQQSQTAPPPHPPSHEFHYPAHFPYPPLAPMPPNPPPPPGPPPYPMSRHPQISPDSVPPRGKRRPEQPAPGRDPSSGTASSSKKARRGAEELSASQRSSSAELPPSSIAFRNKSPSSTASASPPLAGAAAVVGSSLYRGSPTGSLGGMGTPSSLGQSRYDSSLGLLAKRFVHRLRGAPGAKMDLNQLVQELGVQKRRIYDITNVLEGIGLIAKEGKKLVAWVQDPKVDLSYAPEEPPSSPASASASARTEEEVQKQLEEMRQEEANLAQFIEVLQRKSQSLSGDAAKASKASALDEAAKSRRFMFVRYTDITSLPMYGDDSIVGVKAPPGTKVEIPDFEPGAPLQHRMYLNSSVTTKSRKPKDPIRVYLIRPEALPSGGPGEPSAESREPPLATSRSPLAPPRAYAHGGGTPPSRAASRSHGQGGTPTSLPAASRSRSYAQGGTPTSSAAGQVKLLPKSPMPGPKIAAATSYPTPSWGPPGHPPPPMHHHEPQRPVGVTPEEFKLPLGGTPKSSRSDRFRRHEFLRSTPQRPTPPRTSPPSTPFALGEGRWDAPPTPVASGAAAGFFSPAAWSRTGSYFGPPWEEGSVDTPNAFAAPGTFGISRTHSPMSSQQELYNMPLQSPGPIQRGYPPMGSFLSPALPHGFSPTLPGIHYRTTDAQFPLPTLHAEGRTGPPPPRSLGPEEPSRSTISELPDPAEANEPSLPGPAARVKPRRRR